MTDARHAAYRSFVEAAAKAAGEDSYLFDAPRCRFKPEVSDELVAPPGTEVVRTTDGVAVQLPGGARAPMVGFDFAKLRALFAQLPCSYSRLTIELGSQTESFIEQAFSRVLFAPRAVAELETRLPAVEIVRFPGSPYEVVRSYWRNSCAVRERLTESESPRDADELRALLLELHELLLLGAGDAESRSSFYLPASLLGRKRPAPGTFYEVPSSVERRGAETIITSGARVSVPLLGGVNYWQLLAESVDDAGALTDERRLETDGLELGRVVRARAEGEGVAENRPWFLPPRPLKAAHFEALLRDLNAAHAAEVAHDVPAVLAALAAFHYGFVRTHPLPSGNQSLSMSFVNVTLERLLGSGIPHLLLDQLALRFELSAYQRLFARAARVWSAWPKASPGVTSSERLRHLIRMRSELNEFVSALGSASAGAPKNSAMTLIEARAHMATHPGGAELALLTEA
jgi:hypothetical protein